MPFVRALYFAATVINRNALINRDTSATTTTTTTTMSNAGFAGGARRNRAERIGSERNKAERRGTGTSLRRINHFNSCCVALATADKTNERRGAC